MPKTLEENFVDWECHVFGYGYGTGEVFTIPAIKTFLETCNAKDRREGCYNYTDLEASLTPAVAWLLINSFVHADLIEYGTSPRYGWLSDKGMALKRFVETKTADELVDLVTEQPDDYTSCFPDGCNCGPEGYQEGRVCHNPFW
jgi:hypothetical protein